MTYKTELPSLRNTLSSRKHRAEAVINGTSHYIYDENMKMSGNKTYWQFTSNKIGIPTGNEILQPQVVLCGDPVEASRMLRNHIGKPPFPYSEVLVGNGVLGQCDPKQWLKQRECLKPSFKTDEVKKLLLLMHEHTLLYIIQPLLKQNQTNHDIHAFLLESNFNLIGNVVLGDHSDWLKQHGNTLRKAFVNGLQPLYKGTPIGKEAHYIMSEFATHAWDFAQTRRKNNPASSISIVDRLLQNTTISPDQRQDELMTIMFAGHETTANTLSWCLYELSRSIETQDKLRNELLKTMQSENVSHPSQLSFSTLNKLNYLSAALRETMRLWPVVSNGTFRITSEKGGILNNNVTIPPGTPFQVPHWSFHRNRAIWGETADVFDIDRYKTNWNHDAFMPFSKPPRDCLGRHFAMASMRITLVHLLYNFNFKYPENIPAKQGTNWATLQPENGLLLDIQPVKIQSKL